MPIFLKVIPAEAFAKPIFVTAAILMGLSCVWFINNTKWGCSPARCYTKEGYIDRCGNQIVESKFAQALEYHDGFAPVMVKENNRTVHRFIDPQGRYFTNWEFVCAEEFSEGMAAVAFKGPRQPGSKLDSRTWTFLTEEGKLLPLAFEERDWTEGPAVNSFSDGVAVVRSKGLYGLIDRRGTFILAPRFHDACRKVSDGLWGVKEGDCWEFVDRSGKVAIGPSYLELEPFSAGRAVVRRTDGYWAIIDRLGTQVDRTFRSGQLESHNFQEGLENVRYRTLFGPKFGFVDAKGVVVIAPQFDDVSSGFSEGLAPVAVRSGGLNKWGFIDKSGNWVIRPKFSYAEGFHEGRAAVGTVINSK
jgi:hypothetical protein